MAKVRIIFVSSIHCCLLLGVTCYHALADPGKDKKPLFMEVLGHSEWKGITIDLHSTMQPGVIHVPAKKSWFRCKILYLGGASVPVTAFVTKKGNLWVGPEGAGINFYIETEKGVLRGFQQGLGEILWCESLVTMPRDPKISIDQLIAQFERHPDGDAIHDAGIICRRETEKIRYTFFSEALDWDHRLRLPNQSAGLLLGAGIVGIQVIGNTLRLELENKNPELNYAVSVWVDINSKKVLKAVEKGKQVYPK